MSIENRREVNIPRGDIFGTTLHCHDVLVADASWNEAHQRPFRHSTALQHIGDEIRIESGSPIIVAENDLAPFCLFDPLPSGTERILGYFFLRVVPDLGAVLVVDEQNDPTGALSIWNDLTKAQADQANSCGLDAEVRCVLEDIALNSRTVGITASERRWNGKGSEHKDRCQEAKEQISHSALLLLLMTFHEGLAEHLTPRCAMRQ